MTELIEAVAPHLTDVIGMALHGELSRIDVMRYLEMPDNTAERLAQAALTAIESAGYRIVKDEVVAYQFAHGGVVTDYGEIPLTDGFKAQGWTERPLYAAPGDEK